MKNKAVIFDLDGTLIDSIEDLAIIVNQALEENGFETKEIEEYKLFIGDGAKVLIHRASGLPLEHEMITVLHKRFFEIYRDKIDSKTVVYEGIYKLLDKLEKLNYKKAILSNKPDHFTQDCVNKFFKGFDFVNVSGQKKELPKKPDPTAALNIAKQLEEDVSNIYFVGDTKVDINTAKNAGMKSIGVLWGFRDEKELKDHGADYIVRNANELYDILVQDN